MIELERLSDQPVVVPDPARPWERAATFNTAAIYDNGLFPLFYRATDIGCHARFGDYMNSIGYAVSTDGINFTKLDKPVMAPGEHPQELRGAEEGMHRRYPDIWIAWSDDIADNSYRLGAALLDTVIGVAALRMSDARF